MIPDGWTQQSLSEICNKQISYGIVQTGVEILNGIPCLRVVDLKKPRVNISEMITTSERISQSYKKTILEKDEIVMALRGNVGLAKIIKQELVGTNITRGLARLSAKKNKVFPEFLLWELRSQKFQTDLLRRVGGSALQEISISELRKVTTLIPPLSEQKKIARVLSTWDKAIRTTEQILANSQQQKKALMQQLLTGTTRFSKGEGRSVLRFGDLKKEVGCVGDLLNGLESGISVNGTDSLLEPGEFGVLKVSAVSYGHFDPTAVKVIVGEELARAKTNPCAGQIIISRSNTEKLVGASAYIDKNYPHLFLPDKLWQTIPKAGANMKWLSYVLASEHSRYKLSNLSTGTSGSMKNITKGELLSLKILIPPLSEQNKTAKILSAADREIETLQQKLIHLKQEKKALMQQLLTGQRRVKPDTATIPATAPTPESATPC